MAASLTWLDHDTEERDRMHRILALFRERDTRDELGIGSIRDSLADELFPGTSTIQTRLRYMLFVPWIYRQLEEDECPSHRIAAESRKREIALVSALLKDDDTAGIFGKRAKGDLDRLPSSVYWSGLGSWGLRIIDASQDQYHGLMDEIYRCRSLRRREERNVRVRGEGADALGGLSGITWHPKLPAIPPGFPEQVAIALTREEAQFLQDQITTHHPRSLLAKLTYLPPVDVAGPWEHPGLGQFHAEHRELLNHARLLSDVVHGAALLYNLMLAEKAEQRDRADSLQRDIGDWAASLDLSTLRGWSLDWVLPLAAHREVRVSPATLDFCRSWLNLANADPSGIANSTAARTLIRNREMRLKGPRSRFTNARALDQWSGTAGLVRLTYRWPTVTQFMHDLHQGLEGQAHA